jgi:diadenosine tetraphosphatase ApaH/serine/threonine PP2A family protein phosphatase
VTYPKTAIISDLHGNMPALEVALADARERGAQRIVCCGDTVGYGAQPREALDVVMTHCVRGAHWADGTKLEDGLCLQGNHEDALLHSAADFNPKARAAIEWTHREITAGGGRERGYDYWDFIAELEPSHSDAVAMFAHGSPRDPVREYLLPRDTASPSKMAANFAAMNREVCFVGHSHVPAIYNQDGSFFQPRDSAGPYDLGLGPTSRVIVNVGSVGQPRDRDPRLSYVIFDGATVEFVRLDYDHEAAAERIRATGELPVYLADRLASGS